MRQKILFCIFILAVSLSTSAYGEDTFAKRHKLVKNQLFVPERVTVGDEDNFKPQVSEDSKTLFYTKRIRLSHKIYAQDIETGFGRYFIGEEADSKDPAISPDGKYLAFTYYKYDAKGDICYTRIDKRDKEGICITDASTREKAPFWLGSQKIGYIVERDGEKISDIFVYDITLRQKKLLFSSSVLNPSGSKDGSLLTYIKVTEVSGRRDRAYKLAVREVLSGNERIVNLDIPGISAFPVFDSDGQYIYFGHYMNDTTHDQVVDSNDTGVIFRIKLGEVMHAKDSSIVPEPLTSLEYDCNFPFVTGDKLYMTCAFGESLDVYSLPKSGVVPAWTDDKLMEANKTSRSHEDRILTLMSLAYRNERYRSRSYYERVLSENYSVRELNTCLFILDRLVKRSVKDSNKAFYKIAALLIDSEISYSKENPRLLREGFIRKINRNLRNLKARRASLNEANRIWADVVAGVWSYMLGDRSSALKILLSEKAWSVNMQFVHLVRAHFAGLLLERQAREGLADFYRRMATLQVLDEASRVYYGYELLKLLDSFDAKKRALRLTKYKKGANTSSPLYVLLNAESLLDNLSSAGDEGAIKVLYNELFSILKSNSDHYFLKRALFVRSLEKLVTANRWRYMYYIANYWLSSTDKASVEYSYARDQYLYTSLEKAYGLLSDGRTSFAADEFYITLRLTDNLEAHHGFLYSMMASRRAAEIDKKYDFLYDKGYTNENVAYKRAFVAAKRHGLKTFSLSKSDINKGIKFLEKLKLPDHSGVKNLLLGYLYYKKLTFEGKQSAIKILTESAYRNLMLAADLGRYNVRVRSQALMNLGLLYQKVGNSAESLAYLRERGELPFSDDEERVCFLWFYARALYYSGNPRAAYDTLNRTLNVMNDKRIKLPRYPFIEKAAFYLLSEKQYAKAKKYYEMLFGDQALMKNMSAANLLKVRMAYSYVLYRLGDFSKARTSFERVYRDSKGVKIPKPNPQRPYIKSPVYRIQALGFLARLEKDSGKETEFREERLNLLLGAEGGTSGYGYGEDDWRRLTIKEINNLAYSYYRGERFGEALATLLKAIPLCDELLESTMNPLEQAQVVTLDNIFEFTFINVRKTGKVRLREVGTIKRLAGATLDALGDIKDAVLQSRYLKMKAKLEIFLKAHEVGYPRYINDTALKEELKDITQTPQWENVTSSNVEGAREVVESIKSWL